MANPASTAGTGQLVGAKGVITHHHNRSVRPATTSICSVSIALEQESCGWSATMPTTRRRSRSPASTTRMEPGSGSNQPSGSRSQRSPTQRQMAPLTWSSWPGGLQSTGLEPRLREILAGLPDDVGVMASSWLERLGVQTCQDVAAMWRNANGFTVEMDATLGSAAIGPHEFQLARVWQLARKEAQDQVHNLVDAVVGERLSTSVSGGRGRSSVPLPAPKPMPSTVRTMLVTGTGPVDAPQTVAAMVAAPFAKEEAMRQARIDQLFQLALEDIIDLPSVGASWEMLQDPMRMQSFKEATMGAASRLSVNRLGALLNAYKRWKKFCRGLGYNYQIPMPIQTAEFLREVARGGPTAASGMHACLKWFAVNLGAGFQMEHWLNAPFRFHAAAHESRQAPELQPWEFINLLLLLTKSSGSHKALLSMFLMAAMSCIRWEHLQRSSLVESRSLCLEFRCRQGKARKKGSRPPYNWGMPLLNFQGISVGALLLDFYRHEAQIDATFLIPALKLEPSDLWEVTEATTFLANKQMTRARFLELFRGSLVTMGVDFRAAQSATYNRLRRFLPTIANVLGLDTPDLQAIGNWVEIAQGGFQDPQTRKARACIPMGVHYSAEKVLRSVQVKQRCLDRLMALWKLKQPSVAMTEEGLLPRESWMWEEVMMAHATAPPTKGALDDIEFEAIPVEEETILPVESAELAPLADEDPDEALSAKESENSSSDSSPSASDVTVDGADVAGILADPTAVGECPWIKQSSKLHILREECDGGAVPWCRDRPFAQDPKARGAGFIAAAQSAFCQRCLSRMPRGLYSALADHNGWLI